MKRTPLLNTKLVQHMDVPTIPNVLMLDAGESLEDQVFVRGDLLDAESIDIYFKNTQYKLLNVFDVVTAKLRNHISDTFCHTNPIEKRYWNNKVDTSRYEAAMSIVQERLHALEEIIKGVPGEVDFSSFITYNKLIDILSNRDSWPLEIDGYVKEGGKLGTINGVDFYQGASITIGSVDPDDPDAPSTSKSYKVTGLSYNNGQITLSQENNPNSPYRINVPTSEVDQTTINNIVNQVANSISYTANISSNSDDSYKIGTLNVGTSKHFDLYGKDTYGGDGSRPYTLPVASSDELGGIKIGYERGNNDSDRNYAVQLSPDNKAFVYVPWINTPADPDDPDDPEEKKDKIITLTESEFNDLDNAGELEPDTTYIVLDDDTRVVKFICYVDEYGVKHITTMPEDSSEELKVEEVTLEQWNNMTNKDPNTIYIVYSGTDANRALVGLGISTVLTRVPVPANGTVVRLTQSEYDNLGTNIDEGTLYLIVANNAVVKMYLGSIEIPVGSENEVGVIKSILTTMFSEKITWSGDKVESLNWSIIDVDNPGEFYAATGFEDFVKNTVKEAGFISKTDNTNSFAEMFATQVNSEGLVKKASILASINTSGESNVKISADKVDINGIFNQYAQSADKKSASQLLSDGNSIIGRVSVIDNGVLRATEVQQHPGEFTISAVSVDNNNSETSNALFSIKTATKGSEVLISADSIVLDGNTTVGGKLSALSGLFDSLQSNVASFENLYVTKGDFNTLSTNVANIANAYVDEATVRSIASEYATVANSLRVGTTGGTEVVIDHTEKINDQDVPRIVVYDSNGDEVTVIGGNPSVRAIDDTLKNYIDLDGHGFFAGGDFKWDASGNITLDGNISIDGVMSVGRSEYGLIKMYAATYTPVHQSPVTFPVVQFINSSNANIFTIGAPNGAMLWESANMIYPDGSGKFANGNISWTADGSVSITGNTHIGGNWYETSSQSNYLSGITHFHVNTDANALGGYDTTILLDQYGTGGRGMTVYVDSNGFLKAL